MRRSFLCTLLFVCALPAFAAEPPSPADVVRELYAAYAAEDVGKIFEILGARSIDLDYPRRELQGEIWARCVHVESLVVEPLSSDGKTATVRAVARILLTPRQHGVPSERVDTRTFTLSFEEGRWRIVRMPAEEDLLGDRIAAAKGDDAAVHKLLAENERLWSPWLVRKLERYSIMYGRRERSNAPDARIAAAAREVALSIGDRVGVALAEVLMLDAEHIRVRTTRPAAYLARLAAPLAVLDANAEPNDAVRGWWLRAVLLLEENLSSPEGEAMMRKIIAEDRSIEPIGIVSAAWDALGNAAFGRHDFRAAYTAYTTAIAEMQRRRDLLTGMEEAQIGTIFEQQGDPELALQYELGALKKVDVLLLRAQTLLAIARAYRYLGQRDKAEDYAQRALTLTRPTQFKGLVARALATQAELLVDAGELARAEPLLREAADDARQVSNVNGQMDALVGLGKIALAREHWDDALRISGELAVLGTRSEGAGVDRYLSAMFEGRAQRGRGDVAAARRAFERAAAVSESLRGDDVGSDRQRPLFSESLRDAYDELADLLVEQGRPAEALLEAERAKGRVLLDILQSGGREPIDAVLTPAERAKRAALLHTLGERNRQQLTNPKLVEPVREAQRALDAFDAGLAVRHPQLAAQRGETPIVTLAELPSLLPDAHSAFVEFVTHERATDVFVVERSGITHRRIAVARAELQQRVGRFADAVAGNALQWRADAARLYALLLGPVDARLKSKRVLAIVPDDVLWRLPFAALVTPDGHLLVERSATFSVPSISVYRAMSRHKRGGGDAALVAFGNPAVGSDVSSPVQTLHRSVALGPLPDAESEVHRIAALYGASRSRVFTGADADESRAKAQLPHGRVIHLAAHSVLDDHNPMYSEIVLARAPGSGDDGVLQAWEMMDLDLHADLAVLSACSTARGRVGTGEGLIGMAWALFAGGCPSTVATLWNIDSPSAAQLMVEFHRQLLARGSSPFAKAEALRAAQLRFVRGAKPHPFYWSAFALVGAGG